VLDRLDSEEAAAVLRRLLVAHPEIVSETEEIEEAVQALGVVLGLYRAERGKGGELAQWAPYFFAEAAGGAINAWRTGSRNGTAGGGAARRNRARFPQEFIGRFVPEWQGMIRRILSRTD